MTLLPNPLQLQEGGKNVGAAGGVGRDRRPGRMPPLDRVSVVGGPAVGLCRRERKDGDGDEPGVSPRQRLDSVVELEDDVGAVG